MVLNDRDEKIHITAKVAITSQIPTFIVFQYRYISLCPQDRKTFPKCDELIISFSWPEVRFISGELGGCVYSKSSPNVKVLCLHGLINKYFCRGHAILSIKAVRF